MRKVLLGLLLVVTTAGFIYIFLGHPKLLLDSAAVEKMAAEMLPGARPPSGLKGVLGLHPEGLQVAIFAPGFAQAKAENLKGNDLRIMIARPDSSEPPSPRQISDKICQAQKQKQQQMDTLSTRPIALSVAGKPYPGLESQLSLKDNGAQLRENMTVFLVQKRPVVVLISGPETSFNVALRDEFLAALAEPQGPAPASLPKLPLPQARPIPPEPPKISQPPAPPRPNRPSPPARPPAPKRPQPALPPRPKLTRPSGPPMPPGRPLGPPDGPPEPPRF